MPLTVGVTNHSYHCEFLAHHFYSQCNFLKSINVTSTFLRMLLPHVSTLCLTNPTIVTLQDLDLVNCILTPLAVYWCLYLSSFLWQLPEFLQLEAIFEIQAMSSNDLKYRIIYRSNNNLNAK